MADFTKGHLITKGHLTVRFSIDYDPQDSQYTKVALFSDETPLGQEMQLHTDDMKIVAQAMKEYFEL